ncbi:alpha-D-xyloside xylohydrolase [Cellulosimicrobium cellulans]|uniref:glycoside hydrolase family 31 protein n=1 Tax=Cellulosimicrobium cellulans TaxID=1710 RepID=UPI00195DD61E|nr:glycoside hydrolase family 31 protein [Cellulosimicrobium cellulans]MBM7818006.1 alpha-D-xyloside xylohydrolase [Cellulosimicrobium cellulans]
MALFENVPGGLVAHHRHEVVRIDAWGRDSVRVRAARYRIDDADHGALEAPPPGTPTPVVTTDESRATVVVGELTVVVTVPSDAANPELEVAFHRTSDGAELLREQPMHSWAPGPRTYTGTRTGTYELRQEFVAYDDERLFGLGQRTHGRLDVKGLALDLVQRNGEVNVPFVVSSRGYGFLWNNPAVGRVEFAANATRWQAGQSRQIDYWVTAGSPADVLARYADATGHSPDLPAWASGFWQSKLRYRTQDELLEVAREHERRGLPLSVLVCDYFHWTAMGDFAFDPAEWPEPEAMVKELREMGVELMVSIWPTVSPLSRHWARYRDEGLLVGTDQGLEVHQTVRDKGMATPMAVGFYDPSNPRTRAFVWDLVRQNYLDLGIRVWWLDASEPELNPADPQNVVLHAGPGAQVINAYPRDNARLFAEGMAAEGHEPTVLLSRSAWAGSQRYGAAVWSGDIPATWDSLATQVRAGLGVAMSGIPWWTTDIGGFHGGDAADPAYRELMVRWFQFGAFCPLFRLHGDREPRTATGFDQTGGPNEVWSFGDEAYAILADHLHVRERLRPYLHEQMSRAARDGLPPMRPLFVDFGDDARAWDVDDQFLLGPDLLVAPVLRAGERERDVYLPAGTAWTDAWTGQRYDGGATVRVPAPLERIPVLVRDGADVPVAPPEGSAAD